MKKIIIITVILSLVLVSVSSCILPFSLIPEITIPEITIPEITLPDFDSADTDGEEDTSDPGSGETETKMPYYDTCERYARSILTKDQKELYDKILDAALSRKEYADVPVTGDAKYAYSCVIYDTPELFYVSESPIIKNGHLTFNYVFSAKESEQLAKELDNAYNDFTAAGIKDGMTDYEKLQTLYEYIINRTKYNSPASDNYDVNKFNSEVYRCISAIGPLLDGSSICVGYARATQYLALRLGIQTFTVKGGGTGEGDHYFCLVLLDDGYYYVDTTWGDPVDADRSIDHLTYNYFCITTEELLRSHRIESPVPVPECTATKYNYFVYNDLIADSADEFIQAAIDVYNRGEKELWMKTDYGKLDKIYNEVKANIRRVFTENGITGINIGTAKSASSSLIYFKIR